MVKKTVHEIDFSNNINFLQVAHEASLYVRDLAEEASTREGLTDGSRAYLEQLLLDTSNMLEGIIDENKGKAESYKILGNDITNYLLDHRHVG